MMRMTHTEGQDPSTPSWHTSAFPGQACAGRFGLHLVAGANWGSLSLEQVCSRVDPPWKRVQYAALDERWRRR